FFSASSRFRRLMAALGTEGMYPSVLSLEPKLDMHLLRRRHRRADDLLDRRMLTEDRREPVAEIRVDGGKANLIVSDVTEIREEVAARLAGRNGEVDVVESHGVTRIVPKLITAPAADRDHAGHDCRRQHESHDDPPDQGHQIEISSSRSTLKRSCTFAFT